MKVCIIPYNQGSHSAKRLARALDNGVVVRLNGSRCRINNGDMVVNWGRVDAPPITIPEGVTLLNPPDILRAATNKRTFFQTMKEKGYQELVPLFWTESSQIPSDHYPVLCRTQLAGHSGAGIVLADSPGAVVPAPLYVRYVKKKEEYRVHVGGQSIIAVQRKARRRDHETPNWRIRNHANGFIYQRQDVDPPKSVLDAAITALGATGLDFGAVDIIWNDKQSRPYVLEVNTAPGLEGSTVEDYAQYFQSIA